MDLAIKDAPQGCVIVALSGELDIATAPELRERLLDLLDRQAPRWLVLDLSELTFMDSSGTSVLVGTERRARLAGSALALAAPQRAVSRVLQICGLDQHFLIFDDIKAAAEWTRAGHGPPCRLVLAPGATGRDGLLSDG